MFAALKCLLFGHVYGKWTVRGNGGYERRDCLRCETFELKGRGSYPDRDLNCGKWPEKK